MTVLLGKEEGVTALGWLVQGRVHVLDVTPQVGDPTRREVAAGAALETAGIGVHDSLLGLELGVVLDDLGGLHG